MNGNYKFIYSKKNFSFYRTKFNNFFQLPTLLQTQIPSNSNKNFRLFLIISSHKHFLTKEALFISQSKRLWNELIDIQSGFLFNENIRLQYSMRIILQRERNVWIVSSRRIGIFVGSWRVLWVTGSVKCIFSLSIWFNGMCVKFVS